MNRTTFILGGLCMTILLVVFLGARSSSPQQPASSMVHSATAPEVAPRWANVSAEGSGSNEIHPYVESLRTAQARGTASQIRNEMKRLAEYCSEQPGDLAEVLQDLSLDAAHGSETLRIFGEVIMKGRGQPADELIKQTAIAWSQQTADRARQHLGVALLAELSNVITNSSARANP